MFVYTNRVGQWGIRVIMQLNLPYDALARHLKQACCHSALALRSVRAP